MVIKYSDLFIAGYDSGFYIAHLYKVRGYASKGELASKEPIQTVLRAGTISI